VGIASLDDPIRRICGSQPVEIDAVRIDHVDVARMRIRNVQVGLIIGKYSGEYVELIAFDGHFVAVENEVVRCGNIVGLNDQIVEVVVVDLIIDLQTVVQPARLDAHGVGFELLRFDFVAESGCIVKSFSTPTFQSK